MNLALVTYNGLKPVFDSYLPDGGIAQLAGVATNVGANTRFFDLNFPGTRGKLLKYVTEIKPDVIGIKTWDTGFKDVLSLLPELDVCSPVSKVLLGGPHVTLFRESLFSFSPYLKYLVPGEGERALAAFLRFAAGEVGLDEVPNLYYRHGNEIKRSPTYLESDLDSLPFPDYDILPLHRYFPIIQLNFQRGCPYRCAFCSHNFVWGEQENGNGPKPYLRQKSVARVCAETREAIEKWDVTSFAVADSLPDTAMLLQWAKYLLENDLQCEWTAFALVNQYNRQQLACLRNGGCSSLWVGVESGDDAMLERMCKPHQCADAERFFNDLNAVGITGIPGFVVGFPGETQESVQKTVAFARRLAKGNGIISPFILDPGSPVAGNPGQFGVCLLPDAWTRIADRGDKEEFDTYYYDVQGIHNNDYWAQFAATSGYGGEQQDRATKYEFALLLARRVGLGVEEFIRRSQRALECRLGHEMEALIQMTWSGKAYESVTGVAHL